MKANYNYPQEMIDKVRLMFTANFKQDYQEGLDAEQLNLLILQCEQDMTLRDFSITVLKFLKGQKYPDWKIADFYSYYEPSKRKTTSIEFKHTQQGRLLYDGDNEPKPKALVQDEESRLILENLNLKIEIDELKADIKAKEWQIKSLQQQLNFICEIKKEESDTMFEQIGTAPEYQPQVLPTQAEIKNIRSMHEIADEIYKQVLK
jgi:hypothetical protein